jgi:uncharacterized RDD family membrane protein YckC
MDQILDFPSTSQKTLQYAGFWIRFAAFILDYFVCGIISYILLAIFGFTSYLQMSLSIMSQVASVYLIVLGTWAIYFILMESSTTQGTLGKMAVGIKVGSENGERLTLGLAVGRFFGKYLSFITVCIGYMMAGWDSRKQALHDKMANTYVYYERQ